MFFAFAATTIWTVSSAIAAVGGVVAAVLVGLATIRARSFDDLVDALASRFASELRKANRELLGDVQRELDRQRRNDP